ncbi:helix-turn-helix transcriptional regulator [Novosphingobium sp. M1R2S20]|uniref:Helix-turn-helix transcriptional regulator n=1 Tax=Novosphingobium rhizovicinum TaxID=3228928 RepID=A0ABV3R8D3_9SPHN
MALTSNDETDLLLPLFAGAAEKPPFQQFLERLRRRAAATFVSFLIRPGEGSDVIQLFVGPDIPRLARELNLDELHLADRIQYDRLRPGRVYSADEFDDHDPVLKARRARDMRRLGLADERAVRLLDEKGASAWLVIASERACTAADSALLSKLAPYAAIAVSTFLAAERQRLSDAANEDTLLRAGSGWIVFDKAARVLAMAPATMDLFVRAFGRSPSQGQRLRELGLVVERALTDAASSYAEGPGGLPRTLVLLESPRIEAILSPARQVEGIIHDGATMIATCRQVRIPSPSRAEHLAQIHNLPRREAELAILLADGFSLAEAGSAMGLTIETTRNYSKRLFAKVGVRGQAELVRAVYESCAILA